MSWWKKYMYQLAATGTPDQEGTVGDSYNRLPSGDPISVEKALKEYPTQVELINTKALKEAEKPKDPEPDLSTKPKDLVGYCFGYVCPKKHVNSTFENISVDGYKERRACQTCGGVAKPAVVQRTAEARWLDLGDRFAAIYHPQPYEPSWGWTLYRWRLADINWTAHKFVHYLDTPTRRKK